MFKSNLIRALALVVVAFGFLAVSGKSGAAPKRRTLTVGINCYGLGHRQTQCEADVGGAVGSISYQWTPTPAAGGQALAIINCSSNTQPQFITVTVTDSANSATSSDSGYFYCSPPV
jgi:hypothetical protein